MNRSIIRLRRAAIASLFAAAWIGASPPPLSAAQESSASGPWTEEEVREVARHPYANDLGPDSLDVSSYPPEMRQAYPLFAQKCSRCHTLARPINSQWATPVFWEHYVKRMWRMPGSGIGGAQAKQIWEFLVYDSQARKLGRRDEFEAFRKRLLREFEEKYPERFEELYGGLEEEAARLW